MAIIGAAVAGTLMQSSAASNAGEAELSSANKSVALAQQGLQQQIQARADAIAQSQQISGMSAGEISSINQILSTKSAALSASLSSINQQQRQLDAMDPQVKAAGSDLYDLLTGHASAVLAPMQAQIDQQRTQLQGQLESQLGPGWQTSSAGIMAMTQFNMQSATTLQQAQQSAISNVTSTYGNLSGIQNQGQNAVTSQTGEAFGRAMTADQSVLQANQFVTNRQTNAFLGAMSANPVNFMAPSSAQSGVTQVAGDQFAGQAIAGKALSGAATGLLGLGGQMAGSGGGSPFNGSSGNPFSTSPVNGSTFGSTIAGQGGGSSIGTLAMAA